MNSSKLLENVQTALANSLNVQRGDGVVILTDSANFAKTTGINEPRDVGLAFEKAAKQMGCDVALVEVPDPRPANWQNFYVKNDTLLTKIVQEVTGSDGNPIQIIPREEWDSPIIKAIEKVWDGKADAQKIAVTPMSDVVQKGNNEVSFRVQGAINFLTRWQVTTQYIPDKYRKELEHGRLGHMPTINVELTNYFNADYKGIAEKGKRLRKILEKSERVNISSEQTSLMVETDGLLIDEDFGFTSTPGDLINLPSGEIYFPEVKSAEGTFLCNVTTGIGTPSEPILFYIKKGRLEGEIKNWKLKTVDEKFRSLLEDELDNPAYGTRRILRELGFGLNDAVRKPCGVLLADEKMADSAHIAFEEGGQGVKKTFHLDLLHKHPTMQISAFGDYFECGMQIIMNNGTYCF